jgi:hypothetical protein
MPTNPGIPKYVPELSAARDEIGNVVAWSASGYNDSVSNSVEEFIMENGTSTGHLTSASTLRIKAGGDANDATGGTHARKIVIEGLNQNFAEASAELATNGASASGVTTTQFIRVHRVYVTDTGAYGNANADNIIVETSGGVTVAIVGVGYGQTHMAAYTVPAGKTLYLSKAEAFADKAGREYIVKIYQRLNADDSTAPVSAARVGHIFTTSNPSAQTLNLNGATSFPAKTDIWVTGIGDSAGDGLAVSLQGYLVTD